MRRPGIPPEDFLDLVAANELHMYGRDAKKTELPLCITRYPGRYPFRGEKLVDTWASFKAKVHKGTSRGCAIQQFVPSNADHPRITRVVYYNRMYKNKPNKVNYALAIGSKLKVGDQDQTSQCRWCINVEMPHSVVVEKIVGLAVEEYIPYMQSIMDFALRALRIRLKCVVADFIKDQNGVVWFIDLKSFRVPKLHYALYCEMTESPKTAKKPQLQDKMRSYAKCRLCNMKYGKEELQQLLTMNMIIEYKRHLNQRGIFEFDHVDVRGCVGMLASRNTRSRRVGASCATYATA